MNANIIQLHSMLMMIKVIARASASFLKYSDLSARESACREQQRQQSGVKTKEGDKDSHDRNTH